MLASVIVKTYGWQILLGRTGLVSMLLVRLHVLPVPVALTPSAGAVVAGLVQSLLPYGVLAIMASIDGLPRNLDLAAMSLGADRMRTFFRVILPLTWPGIVGGFALAFSIALSAYATPFVLGGPRNETLATSIYTAMVQIVDWSLGSALGVILVVSATAAALLGLLLQRRRLPA